MNEVELARRYISKSDYAKTNGHEFSLSFGEYKRLMKRKTCVYTGLPFTIKGWTKRTLDRVDNSLGYIPGNVIPVCDGANQLKSVWENPRNPLDATMVEKIIRSVRKHEERANVQA